MHFFIHSFIAFLYVGQNQTVGRGEIDRGAKIESPGTKLLATDSFLSQPNPTLSPRCNKSNCPQDASRHSVVN